MNTQDFINNAEYLIRQCLNQKNIDPTMEAWLRDACLDLAKAREKDIRKTEYNTFDDWAIAKGLSPADAQDFAVHIRYKTELG
jgi:hypothetical protein